MPGLSEWDRLNVDGVEDLFRQLKEHLLRKELIGSLSDIDLVWLNDDRITALVTSQNGKYVICISTGMVRAIWNLLVLTLCNPDILTDYPDDDKVNYTCEKKIPRSLLFGPAIIPSNNYDKERDAHAPGIYQNITASRLELCETMFNSIMDYVLYHEAMHITRDHLSFLAIYNNEPAIRAMRMFREPNSRVLQFLEIDADMGALSYSIESHTEFTNIHHLSESGKRDFFFAEIFKYLIVQQLLDFDCEDISQQLQGTHPPPIFRGALWNNLLRQIYKKSQILEEDLMDDEQDKAWWEASQIAEKLGFPPGRWHGDHTDDVPFSLLEQIIDEFNVFQAVIERSHASGDYTEFREYVRKIPPDGSF